MISLDKINKTFKPDVFGPEFVALKNVSFNIPKGKITGFLGANGAGKTTSMKIMMEFIKPTSGSVFYNKELGNGRGEIFNKIGFLPERPYFYPHLSGEDFLIYMGRLHLLPKNKIKERINKWAPRFKIDFALKREIKTYSKGMLQRIGFLATLIHEPRLIILDEPLSGLDPIGRKELKDVIVEIYKENKTIFFSSHIISDIEEISQEVIFLKDGELEYSGEINSLLDKHLTSDYIIKTRDVNSGQIHKHIISEEMKDKKIQQLIKDNFDIVGLEKNRLNLEEIFYKEGK